MSDITVDSKDGSFYAYLATPTAGSGSGIVLIHRDIRRQPGHARYCGHSCRQMAIW